MKKKILAFLLSVFCSITFGQVRLPSIFADNMVLQQKSNVRIWGWGNPGSIVTVNGSWGKDTVKTKIENDASWELKLETPTAGGPFTLTIGSDTKIQLSNVMVGEVWICSGQSNMEWKPSYTILNGEEEMKNANYPNVRFFGIKKVASKYPQDNCMGSWEACTPLTMRNFSAVGYTFARELNLKMNIPIGIISAAWGATHAELWVKKSLIESDSLMKNSVKKIAANIWCPTEPGVNYNGMISPIKRYSIAGVLWYQGESNVSIPESYEKVMHTLIDSWRGDFGKELPFYFVQIAPFKYNDNIKAALLREAQVKCLSIPKTGMVVITDLVDDIKNIHPKNKTDVGKRLSNMVLAEVYAYPGLVYKFPMYRSMAIVKNKIKVELSNCKDGLMIKNGTEPLTFEVAGADRLFMPATATVEGNSLVVWNKDVKSPVAVRYSFSNEAIGNIFSNEGLPLAPFRSDSW